VSNLRIHQRFLALMIAALGISSIVPVAALAGTAPSDTPHFRTVRVQAAGVSLQYPHGWIVFALTKQGVAAQQRQLSERDPRLAEAFSAEVQTVLLPGTRFEARDLGSAVAAGVSNGVTVQVVRGGFPSSLTAFTSAREPSVEQQGGTVLNASTGTVRGAASYRLDVSLPVRRPDGTSISTRLGQLLIRRSGGRVVITVATSDDAPGSKLIDHVLDSVRRS
jgi:hypothetical protein